MPEGPPGDGAAGNGGGPGPATAPDGQVPGAGREIEAGSHRFLRARLEAASSELARRAGALNQCRLDAFGTGRLELLATERVRTDSNVVPRDITAAGDQVILAYNLPSDTAAGIRAETRPEEVFAVHHLSERDGELVLSPNPDGLAGSVLDDERFRRDVTELHTYYRDARIVQLYRRGQLVLAAFSIGGGSDDLKVLRWSVEPDGGLTYLDDRGDRDHRFPPRHDVEWRPTTRADHRTVDGSERVVAVGTRVLVDPLGGTLDVLLADAGGRPGEVLLSEPVDDADQGLQDCAISWAPVGEDLVLLEVRPYREEASRWIVVNLLVRRADRLDGMAPALRVLPDRQGLIFPAGIYLRTGEVRRFDLDPEGMELLEVVRSPNGEDVLYVFHQRRDGRSILLPYNVVRQDVSTPIWCHGHCLLDDGRMILFREEPDPTRIHPVQVWATPFCSDQHHAEHQRGGGPLDRIGNADLVAGIADALALTRLVADVEPSADVYGDLLASAGRVLDGHHWLGDPAIGELAGGDLASPVHDIRMAAEAVLDELERLTEIRAAAAAAVDEAEAGLTATIDELRLSPPSSPEQMVAGLRRLRHHLGHLQSLGEQREVDTHRVAALVERATSAHEGLARRAADELSRQGAFDRFHQRLAALAGQAADIDASVTADRLLGELEEVADSMEVVASTIGDLVVPDPRVRTAVLEQVSAVLAELNRVRAGLDRVRTSCIETETGAAFTTELGLLGQSMAASLARVSTPEEADDALGRLLAQLEQLESSGPRTEAQLDELAERREQVVDAFDGRRQRLVDERRHRLDRLASAADRIVGRAAERATALADVDEVNGFFAADPLIGRLRSLIDELRALGDPVRADELAARLGGAREAAVRTLRDRADLVDGDIITLGRHRFSIERRRRELSLVASEGRLTAVLTGTDLQLPVDDEELAAERELWPLSFPSETPDLPRALFLAADLLLDALDRRDDDLVTRWAHAEPAALSTTRQALDQRHDEGYDRGVHDLDAARLLGALAERALAAGPLRAPAPVRCRAQATWSALDAADRARWLARGRAAAELQAGAATLRQLIDRLMAELGLGRPEAGYLVTELTTGGELAFVQPAGTGATVAELARRPATAAALGRLADDPDGALELVADHVARAVHRAHLVADVTAALVLPDLPRRELDVDLDVTVDGLLGGHPVITDGVLAGRLDELLTRVDDHRRLLVPRHRRFGQRRRQVTSRLRDELRLDELEARVPEGFVRNRLIDRAYLPLIGDNLARQIGTVDDPAGARSGLLLLLSPPGYGKTTLVQYLAASLGMALVSVSGPGLGHEVTSLDPERAPSATAAREVARLNLAFALGSNVLLHLDDIQHTNPELLQRFISLCDAQRRIEGVVDGRATTFDLRGKRFAVVMAGNPYTESGRLFRIPDMLANRADTYNLGDVVAGDESLFAASYLENALAANPVVASLAGDHHDLEVLLAAAREGRIEPGRLRRRASGAELEEQVAVIGHLLRIQDVVLAVNRRYIASAATDDAYRTEPPFLLQGSYRNMVRLASKVVPAMTPAEVDSLIDDHYRAESQSLTGAAEANLLMLDQLRGRLDGERRRRWDEILAAFARERRLGGDGRDPTTRVVAAIEEVALALGRDRWASAGPPS